MLEADVNAEEDAEVDVEEDAKLIEENEELEDDEELTTEDVLDTLELLVTAALEATGGVDLEEPPPHPLPITLKRHKTSNACTLPPRFINSLPILIVAASRRLDVSLNVSI